MHVNAADTITLEERVDMLNTDQRRVFEKAKSRFLHHNFYEGNKCKINVTSSLCVCLSVVLEVQGNRFSMK